MESEFEGFYELMEQVRAGSEEAAQRLVERYGPHVLKVVRRRLHAGLRPAFDSTDFTQAVWASFFADRPESPEFDNPRHLVAYLAAMAYNKVMNEERERGRPRPFRRFRRPSPAARPQLQPTPSEVVGEQDEWDHVLGSLPELHRHVLTMLRAGETRPDVARKLGISLRTVNRVVQRVSQRSLSHVDPTAPGPSRAGSGELSCR